MSTEQGTSSVEAGGELAVVRRLPVRDAVPAEDQALDGEIMTAEEYERLMSQRGQAIERYRGYRRDAVTVARTVRTVATHDTTAAAGKALVRHVHQVGRGHSVWARRAMDRLTHAAIQEQIDHARAAGDGEALALWQDRLQHAHDRRAKALRELPATLKHLVLLVAVVVTVILGLLVTLGIAVTVGVGWTWGDYLGFLVATGRVGLDALAAAAALAPVGWLWAAHRAGRPGDAPSWSRPGPLGDGQVDDVIPTADSILTALRYLGIPKLDKAFKAGWGSAQTAAFVFDGPVLPSGKGFIAKIKLPKGVIVEDVVNQKKRLAGNLNRSQAEVWLETGATESDLVMWIADQGSLSGPIGEWPLLAELDTARTDYFASVPVGVTPRGDIVKGTVWQRNWAICGEMGSGKSSFVLTTVLGLILDPIVEVDVFVFAENSDWLPMKPRLNTLMVGGTADVADAALDHLQNLYKEALYRGQRAQDTSFNPNGDTALTREMALKDPRMRPRVVVFDECQNLFADRAKNVNEETGKESGPARGKLAIDAASKLAMMARKWGITLVLLTPEPTNDAIPRQMASVFSNRACGAIGDQVGNDAALGTGSYKRGISAMGLVPKDEDDLNDCGTLVTSKGFLKKPGLIRSFHVKPVDARRVTERAMQLRAELDNPPVPEDRDPLSDVLAVLGSRSEVSAKDVTVGLRELAPGHGAYAKLSGSALWDLLRDKGADLKLKDGKQIIRRNLIEAAVAGRETLGECDEEG